LRCPITPGCGSMGCPKASGWSMQSSRRSGSSCRCTMPWDATTNGATGSCRQRRTPLPWPPSSRTRWSRCGSPMPRLAAGVLHARLARGGVCDLAYFGLVPEAVGGVWAGASPRGACQGMGAGRRSKMTVNTCTLDHPRALDLYKKMGFSPVDTEDRTRVLCRDRDTSLTSGLKGHRCSKRASPPNRTRSCA
jgi:hypothetical protein